LLSQLLGPGGAWIDVHAALLQSPIPWTFHSLGASQSGASRIDLVLANHSAMALVQSATVMSDIQDGGHSPVLVTLRLPSALPIIWQQPRPKLPPILTQPSSVLQSSADWANLMDRWLSSPAAQLAVCPHHPHDVESLGRALTDALQYLVLLAGGWSTRPSSRRPAYDSDGVRQLRRRLELLQRLRHLLQAALDSSAPRAGSWPRPWLAVMERLQHLGILFTITTTTTAMGLLSQVLDATARCRKELDALLRQLRSERQRRWKATLPGAWRDRPAIIYHWLHAPRPQWGALPILDSAGEQCTTVQAVDAAVRHFWVGDVLRRHAASDATSSWSRFQASQFYTHIPKMQWPSSPWDGARVQAALVALREASAPGRLGIPISVWRSLPTPWADAVARLFTLVEQHGRWPSQWVDAYVVMIPKASGGSRPRDQRPITVLDVLYRVWSKGLVREWSPAIQRGLLGSAAMGFRAQTGALHLAQLLSDLIALRRRDRRPLYLVSFDLEKCYDTIPWWAIFNTLLVSGAPSDRVNALQSFYQHLRRCFRYGQVEGDWWLAANGFPQGCSLSPDLLNILMESFHRWARATGLGVIVEGFLIPSVSFADDLALVAASLDDLLYLAGGYLEWCQLLGLRVTKVQLWTNGSPCTLKIGELSVESSPTFRMVGVVLGQHEAVATTAHVTPRLEKAIVTAQRLQALELPASICSLLWRTTVLPQALYGCEVRHVRPSQLAPLLSLGKTLLTTKAPLQLNVWRSPAALCGLPLGDTALRDPCFEVRLRQLVWLQLLANLPSIVGIVHRYLAWQHDTWVEPTPALHAALQSTNWSVHRNTQCLRAAHWPTVSPEMVYPGTILLQPEDTFPQLEVVFTDGSLKGAGGAAAVQPDTNTTLRAHLPDARSSTQCELAALCLAMSLSPPQILTDSLCSLQLLQRWHQFSPARVLLCLHRVSVRQLLHLASQCSAPPLLEKVLAHDTAGIQRGHPKSLGNDEADQAAAAAALSPAVGVWVPDGSLHGDPVEIRDSSGAVVASVQLSLPGSWWREQMSAQRGSRHWLLLLYPDNVEIDWLLSTVIFQRPTTSGGRFIHRVAPAVIKWLARVRTGSLATRARRHKRKLDASPACPCCDGPVEDDAHVVAGCPATGSADWQSCISEAWATAVTATNLQIPLPEPSWVDTHRLQLMAAIIPASLQQHTNLPGPHHSRFCTRLHVELAIKTAHLLGRRESLIFSTAVDPSVTAARPASLQPSCPLPLERQFSPVELRTLEQARRQQLFPSPSAVGFSGASSSAPPATPLASTSSSTPPRVPQSGAPRRQWMRERLVALLREDTVPCAVRLGATSPMLVELFERVTRQPFTDTPGSHLTSRIQSLGRLLREVLTHSGASFSPPLETSQVVSRQGAYATLNRFPKHPCPDISSWRRRVSEMEQYQTPQLRPRQLLATQDTHLNLWVRGHRHLLQTDNAAEWESSVALLLLWEVDHDQDWPTTASQRSGALAGFTKKLQQQVLQDDELQLWFTPRELQRPLAPGLADSHQLFWPVRVRPPAPAEPQGWYADFITRWKAHIATLAVPLGVAANPTIDSSARRVRQRIDSTASASAAATSSTTAAPRRRSHPAKPRASPENPASALPVAQVAIPSQPSPTVIQAPSSPPVSVQRRHMSPQPPSLPPNRKRRRSETSVPLVITSQGGHLPSPPSPTLIPVAPARPTRQSNLWQWVCHRSPVNIDPSRPRAAHQHIDLDRPHDRASNSPAIAPQATSLTTTTFVPPPADIPPPPPCVHGRAAAGPPT
jgi:hypothetical protein